MGASEANAPAADASLLLISVLSDRSFVSLQPRYLNWSDWLDTAYRTIDTDSG